MRPLTMATLREAAAMIRTDPDILVWGMYANRDNSRYCAVGLLARLLGYAMDDSPALRNFQTDVVSPMFRDIARAELEPTCMESYHDSWCIVANYSNHWVAMKQPLKVAELFEAVADRIDAKQLAHAA